MYFNIYKVNNNSFHIDRDVYDEKVKETVTYGSKNESNISEYSTYEGGSVKNSRFLAEKPYYIPNNVIYRLLEKFFGSIFETKIIVHENTNLLYLFKNYFIRKFKLYCSITKSGYNQTNWVFTDLDTYVSKSIKNDTSFFNEKNMLDYDLVILHYPSSTQNNILNVDKIFSLAKKRKIHNLPTIFLFEDSRVIVNKNNPKINIIDKLKDLYKPNQICTFESLNFELKTKFFNYLLNTIELDKLLCEDFDTYIESYIQLKKDENVLLYNYSQLSDKDKRTYENTVVNKLTEIQTDKKTVVSSIDSIRTLSNNIKLDLSKVEPELFVLLDKYGFSNNYSVENYFKKLNTVTSTPKKEFVEFKQPQVKFTDNIDSLIEDINKGEEIFNQPDINNTEGLNLSKKSKSKSSFKKIKTTSILDILNKDTVD